MIPGLVLAAGESRRMGRHKLLLPYGSSTVIEHVVDQLLQSAADAVYVVVGHEASRVMELLCERNVRVVTNSRFHLGMLSSVRCGMEAIGSDVEAYLIALGDQPFITSAVVDGLIDGFRRSGKGIAMPVYRGKRGHPLIVSSKYRTEVLTQFDDVGLHGLTRAHADDIAEIEMDLPGVTRDIDTPEDYRRALEELGLT